MKQYELRVTASSKCEIDDFAKEVRKLNSNDIFVKDKTVRDKNYKNLIEGIIIANWVISIATGISVSILANLIYDLLKSKNPNNENRITKTEKLYEIEIIDQQTGLRLAIKKNEKEERKKEYMIIASESVNNKILKIDKIVINTTRKSLLSFTSTDEECQTTVSPLTSALLQDLTEISLKNLGEDPLSKFDTSVALISGEMSRVYCDPTLNLITFSDSFLSSVEFSAANLALTNLLSRLKQFYIKNKNDKNNLAGIIDESKNAVYGLMQARLLLHAVGEEKLPSIASLLPDDYWPFIHHWMTLSLIFILLHEQAHLEFYRKGKIESKDMSIEQRVIIESVSSKKEEEYAADTWAVKQVRTENRMKILKAGLFFLLNYWTLNYITYKDEKEHPADYNRAHALANEFSDFQKNDPEFFKIVNSDLSKQKQFCQALERKNISNRYSSMTRYCRELGKFTKLEELVKALSEAYKEVFPR